MPLDDTWIHFTFARNLSQYGSFGLNPGEFSGGATSPLWVLILALAYGLTHQMFFSALALGALFTLLTALSVYHLVCDLTKNKNVSFFAAAFSLVSGRFLWGGFSGMEVPLFAFLTVQAIYWHQRFTDERKISFFSSFLFGLATLARPEGYLLFGLAFVELLIRNFRFTKENGLRLACFLALYGLLVAPNMLFSWMMTGRILCSSYYSKMSIFWSASPMVYLREYLKCTFLDNPVLFFFIFPGLVGLLKNRRYLLAFWLLVFPIVAAWKAPLVIHHMRYTMPFVPLYASVGCIGLFRLCQKRFFGAAGIVFFVLLFFTFEWSIRFSRDVASIQHQQVPIARWLKQHVPEGVAVGTNDIGAISYLSGRKVVDLCGIADARILDLIYSHGKKREMLVKLYGYLSQQNVRYLAVYPEWFRGVLGGLSLKKVYEVRLKDNTITGGDTMEVYEIL